EIFFDAFVQNISLTEFKIGIKKYYCDKFELVLKRNKLLSQYPDFMQCIKAIFSDYGLCQFNNLASLKLTELVCYYIVKQQNKEFSLQVLPDTLKDILEVLKAVVRDIDYLNYLKLSSNPYTLFALKSAKKESVIIGKESQLVSEARIISL